jgi:hypothetical protein
MKHRLLVLLSGLLLPIVFNVAPGAPHPFFDDNGMIAWRSSWAVAYAQAQKYGKPLYVEAVKDKDKNSEKLSTINYRDERLSQFLNRYFIPVSIDATKPPPELKAYFVKTTPVILFISERGQYLSGMAGYKKTNEIEEEVLKILQDKAYVIPKNRETELEKQVDALKAALDDKAWAKAVPIYKTIMAVRGYGPIKEKAFELMDAAQADATKEVRNAYATTRKGDYAEARKALETVIKDYAGAPVADVAKEHLGALKNIEVAEKLAADTKVNRKGEAVRYYDQILLRYLETPYAALAQNRKKDLIKMATGK